MGKRKIGVGDLGHRVNTLVCAQLGIRRVSGRGLARSIGRSESYVRQRLSRDREWALGDVERICRLWDIDPVGLLDMAAAYHDPQPDNIA